MSHTPIRTSLLLLLWACLPLVPAAAQEPPPEPDLTTPAVQALRQEYLDARTAMETDAVNKLTALLEGNLKTAQNQLTRKKVAGNISGIASGKKAVSIFTTALAELKEKGTFTLPEKVRREIRTTIDQCRRQQTAIAATLDSELVRVHGEFSVKLGDLLAQQGTPIEQDSARREWLTRLAKLAHTPATGTGPGTGDPDAPGAPAPPTLIAESGAADQWLPLARFEAEIRDLEVLEVPLLAQAKPTRTKDNSPNTGQPYSTHYIPLRELTSTDPPPLFRLTSIPPHRPVDVLTWPSARNNWTLELRARPAPRIPSRNAVLIEVNADAQTREVIAAPLPGDSATPAGETITVHVDSVPQGAVVFIDGKMLGINRKPLRTPSDLKLRPGSRTVQLQKFGYHPVDIDVSQAQTGQTFTENLLADPRYVDKTLTVSARSGWSATGIFIRKGSVIKLTAKGTWACGTKGERVNADGYPNNDRFHQYYVSSARAPRQINTANYGALLMRIGTRGQPMAVGRLKSIQAPADGTLYLDINEATGPTHRSNNKGSLEVRVAVAPSRK